MIQQVFGFPLDVRFAQDFSFVTRYGAPFAVSAEADAGVVALGVEGPQHGRLLIRFAGAALTEARRAPEEAAHALRAAMPVYEALYPHSALIKLQGHGAVAGGYAAIFSWPAGERLQTREALALLLRQPLLSRLRMIDAALDFHAYALSRGYLPVGFETGRLAADFATARLTVCDVDLYRPLPAVNDRGRMPGSPRFLAPEEYEPQAALDEITAQYAMGALAFAFFANHGSRERAAWTAGEPLYQVAARACSESRAARYPTYAAFLREWRDAVGRTVR